MKKVLLKDIADMAGVSQMTVSRVINAPDTVKKDTRERVEKIIQQMDKVISETFEQRIDHEISRILAGL